MGLGGWLVDFPPGGGVAPCGRSFIFFACPKKTNQKKGHPADAPFGCAPWLRGFPDGPFPPPVRRCLRGGEAALSRCRFREQSHITPSSRFRFVGAAHGRDQCLPDDLGYPAVSSPAIEPGSSVLARSRQFKLDVGAGARAPRQAVERGGSGPQGAIPPQAANLHPIPQPPCTPPTTPENPAQAAKITPRDAPAIRPPTGSPASPRGG